jgi:hypothetical protein
MSHELIEGLEIDTVTLPDGVAGGRYPDKPESATGGSMISETQFYYATGRWPENDDMERVNCDKVGEIGHLCCGWCVHEQPTFGCLACTQTNIGKMAKRQDMQQQAAH